MLLHSVLITIYALPVLIRGKQIPVFDRVIGGVPSPDACSSEVLDNAPPPPTPGKLRGVVENSGICETTPHVYQASGYGDLASDKSIWFWFFAARNNSDKAPLITWFDGGFQHDRFISGAWSLPYQQPEHLPYLNDPTVAGKISSQSTWAETNYGVFNQFGMTGDWIRSSRPNLELVINAGVRTVIYDGDADYICNYMGVEAMVRALNTLYSPLYASQNFSTYNVRGKPAGQYKNAGTFSYLRVYGAGHEVPAYLWRDVPRGAAALQMFTQIMSGNPLSST